MELGDLLDVEINFGWLELLFDDKIDSMVRLDDAMLLNIVESFICCVELQVDDFWNGLRVRVFRLLDN